MTPNSDQVKKNFYGPFTFHQKFCFWIYSLLVCFSWDLSIMIVNITLDNGILEKVDLSSKF